MRAAINGRDLLILLALTAAALALHGYHYGVEDQAIYLPAVKRQLDPSLYPHDAAFVLQQPQYSLFPALLAGTVRVTSLSLEAVVFGWWCTTVFLILLGCLQLCRKCFREPQAQWAGVAAIVALFSLPVTNTGIQIVEQYLHPRGMATAALLFALVSVLDRRLSAFAWWSVAAALHPTMALFGGFHLLILAWNMPPGALGPALLTPATWDLSNSAWREALYARRMLWPLEWHWYEWLGVAGPVLLLGWFAGLARRSRLLLAEHLSRRLMMSAGLGAAAAVTITLLPGFERIVVVEPMRVLHLPYLVFFLSAGGFAGQYLLHDRPLRWLMLFLPLCGAMLYANQRQYPASSWVEWPGGNAGNAWVEAFDWVRGNTPRDALFSLDPVYMERPGEDQHGFGALAARSMLADYTKGRGVATQFPGLAYEWRQQVRERAGWRTFTAEDFRRLRHKYGVSWVVLEQPGAAGLRCPYQNEHVRVCRVE